MAMKNLTLLTVAVLAFTLLCADRTTGIVPPIAETSIPLGTPIDRFLLTSFEITCLAVTPFDSGMVTVVQWVRSEDMSIVSFDPASPVRQISSSNSSGHVVTLIFDRFTDEQAGAYLCVSSNEGGNFTSMTDIRILPLGDPRMMTFGHLTTALSNLIACRVDVDLSLPTSADLLEERLCGIRNASLPLGVYLKVISASRISYFTTGSPLLSPSMQQLLNETLYRHYGIEFTSGYRMVSWSLYECITNAQIASSITTIAINASTVPVSVRFLPFSGTLLTTSIIDDSPIVTSATTESPFTSNTVFQMG